MKRIPEILAAAALAGLPAAASAQTEDLRPVDRDAVFEATPACRDLPVGLDEAERRVTAAGWTTATFRRPANIPADVPLRMFRKGEVILYLTPMASQVACTVMARVARGVRTPSLVSSATRLFGSQPATSNGPQAVWDLGNGRGAVLTHRTDAAGDDPAVAILFGPLAPAGN